MSTLPTVSIVVPNFNGGKTIEATLRSLIDQGYPNLEIIVMDGGSTDNSVDVIRSYEKQITSWVSEKDRGQSDAINRGFAKATGEIVNWLCSDDRLLPGALEAVGKYFSTHPDIDVVAGACRYIYLHKGPLVSINRPTPENFALMPIINTVGQAGCFYRRSLLDRPGPLREDLHYAMDMDLWCYFRSQGRRWGFIDDIISEAIEDGQNKTSTGGLKIVAENEQIYRRYCREWIPMPFWYKHVQYPLRKYMIGNAPRPLRAVARQLRRTVTLLLTPFYGLERLRTMECWYQFFEPDSVLVSTPNFPGVAKQ
jgi:glycosyltransferase involved in cell wall biosynthesis